MRPPGDASRGGQAYGAHSRDELQQKPIPQDDERRNGNEEEQHESQHASPRKKNNIGAHDSGDCAASTQGGQGGMKVEKDMAEAGAYAADQVKEKIGKMAEVVLDVIAEDPEKQHVSGDMSPATVQEHAGQDGEEGQLKAVVAAQKGRNVGGYGGISQDEGVGLAVRERERVEKDDHVHQDEHRVHDRVGPVRVQIFERNKHGLEWFLAPRHCSESPVHQNLSFSGAFLARPRHNRPYGNAARLRFPLRWSCSIFFKSLIPPRAP